MRAYAYAQGHLISLFDEAKARDIDLDDDRALDALWGTLRKTLLNRTVLTGENLLHYERYGTAPDASDDVYGMIVAVGFGVNKRLKGHPPPHEMDEVKAAVKDISLVPGSDELR